MPDDARKINVMNNCGMLTINIRKRVILLSSVVLSRKSLLTMFIASPGMEQNIGDIRYASGVYLSAIWENTVVVQ